MADRAIVTVGLATSSIPEFVTRRVLAYCSVCNSAGSPSRAQPPDGAGVFTQLHYLFLPALAL